ncbi:cytochrome P450 [Stereum hirsutum FP-91666 SS1]|uniref:cytochrome P450 n=1 Tax=Stereum hirsutum (strain FP-91666) TaxID=721885 RepID=UPI000444A155|nr:cytochrome P450 [Stereum hirsutum FP-91666 SS1]EIM82506.1 cytochrome P450 [Stereum hirsutum FP-91666 SS1]
MAPKHFGKAFVIPRWSGWLVLITGDTLVDELHQLPDDVLSLTHSAHDELQISYTMAPEVHSNPYHVPLLAAGLTRHLDHLTREILDEIIPAFNEVIGHRSEASSGWTEVNIVDGITQVMARSFSRIIVGAPLCRDAEYNRLIRSFTVNNVMFMSSVIHIFPRVFRPIVGHVFSVVQNIRGRAVSRVLGPAIEERKLTMQSLSWSDEPNDVLSWLLHAAVGSERETRSLETRILAINAAAIHGTSLTFVQALLALATHPTYVQPLKEEAERTLRKHGWTRTCMRNLPLMDSFFKESMRLYGIGSMGFPRKALKPFMFSDGTVVPEGSMVSAAFTPHVDDRFYEDAKTFDPYRFPGRFLASHVLKALMLHIVLNYELKIGGDGHKKPDMWFGYHCSPNIRTTIAFRPVVDA